MLKEALPVIMQCRLMEMIELKPWINRARANTPASDALAQSMKRGEAARKRTNELYSRTSSAARRARSRFFGVEFDARDDVINEMSRRLSAAGRSNVSEPRRVIRSALTDANYGVAVRRVLGPGQGVIEGPISQRSDRVVKKFGRPSPASMESSIVRRGSLMEREYIRGGKAAGMDVKRFPKQQLRMGTKVEHEHTPKAGIAQEIAKDHLAEFPDYYTRLRKMEHKAARALRGKRGGKMRELKHEITESIVRRGILMEGAWDRMKGMLSKAGAAVKKHSPALARDAAQSPLELASLVEPTGFLRGAYQGPVPKRFRDSSKMDQLKKHIGVGSNTTVHNRPPEFGEHPLGHMMHQGMKYKRDLLDKVTPRALKKRAMRMFDRGNNNAIMVPSAKDKTSVGFADKPDKFDVFPLGHKPLDMATASHELGHAKEHGKMSFGTALVKRNTDAGTLYDEIQATRRGIRGLKHLGRAEGRPVTRRELRNLMRANRSYAVQTLVNKAREVRGKLKVDPSY